MGVAQVLEGLVELPRGSKEERTRQEGHAHVTAGSRCFDALLTQLVHIHFLDGDVDALARVILDFDNYTKWFWETRESRLVKQISPTEYIVYMVHKAPYTLPDRDTVLRGVVEPQTRSKPYVVLRVSAMPDYLPLKPPLVRMPAEEMTIKFSPLPGNKVQMEAEGYFDPGGTLPAWAANFVQRAAPYSVVLGMQRMMAQDKYQKGRNLPFPVYSYSFYNNANGG